MLAGTNLGMLVVTHMAIWRQLVVTNMAAYTYQKHNVGNVGNVVIRF